MEREMLHIKRLLSVSQRQGTITCFLKAGKAKQFFKTKNGYLSDYWMSIIKLASLVNDFIGLNNISNIIPFFPSGICDHSKYWLSCVYCKLLTAGALLIVAVTLCMERIYIGYCLLSNTCGCESSAPFL